MLHYGKNRVCQARDTLGKGHKTLGKDFAECTPSANWVGIGPTGKELFAEFCPSGCSAKPLPCVKSKLSAKKVNRRYPNGDGEATWH